MSLPEAVIACAKIVERADPLRFRTVMAAPVTARAPLFVLYAFNAEVARAPWLTEEAMIAEMRLQWWRDVLEEIAERRPVRAHEVSTPLSDHIGPDHTQVLDRMIAARRWDIYKEPFEDEAHFDAYIQETAGGLMWTAAQLLGAPPETESEIRDVAYGAGVAAFFRAIPDLVDKGRIPLLDGTDAGVVELAQRARKGLKAVTGLPVAARPALWPAIGARATLTKAIIDPHDVANGLLPQGVPAWRLSLSALSGRIWF